MFWWCFGNPLVTIPVPSQSEIEKNPTTIFTFAQESLNNAKEDKPKTSIERQLAIKKGSRMNIFQQ